MELPRLFLHPGKEQSLLRFHRWIFSGAVKTGLGLKDGTLCEIFSSKNQLLATAHYNEGSIVARILSFGPISDLSSFYTEQLKKAFSMRSSLLLKGSTTNIFRLVHGEGDGLPGLIVDVYGQTAVLQAHSVGMFKDRKQIAQALIDASDGKLSHVYSKSKDSLPGKLGMDVEDGFLIGNLEEESYVENGIKFAVDFIQGQKTGFFVDQRENRALLGSYSKGKRVLNTFCYTGGFSMYALENGASFVCSVDSSKRAMDMVERNLDLNGFDKTKHESLAADVMEYIKDAPFDFDIVVLDPPAFAKNIKNRHSALMAYKRLNEATFKRILPQSLVFTFSCSQVVDADAFEGAVRAAAIEAKRSVRILHRLRQPADHPVSIFHPEGEYLKGLVVYVN